MTRDDVMRLSGRELDAAVAERVLGWKRGNPKYGDMPWYPPGTGRYLGGGRLEPPRFSTDIAAAWSLIEGDHWFDSYLLGRYGSGYALWRFPAMPDRTLQEPEAYGDTAAEAICRMALLIAQARSEPKNAAALLHPLDD